MMHALLPHQQQALTYALARPRIALFMEMRLGKSVVAIRWAQHHRCQRVLLIAPQNVLRGTLNWPGELAREGQPHTLLSDVAKEDRVTAAQYRWRRTATGLQRTRATGWFLLHYEGLRVNPEVLDLPWDAVVLDESTYFRNPQAQISKLLMRRIEHVPYRAALSGLPNPEGTLDFFMQFRVVFGDFYGMSDYWAFRHTYYQPDFTGHNWIPNPGVEVQLQRHVHTRAFMLTRKRAKVGSAKVYRTLIVEQTAEQMAHLEEAARDFAVGPHETQWSAVVHGWLHRMAGGFSIDDPPRLLSENKMRRLMRCCTRDFPTQPLVVWFRFNHEIDAAYDWLSTRGVSVERIHGGMNLSGAERAAVQERFHRGDTRVLLIQTSLGRFGWNLSNADIAIYYSHTYAYEDRHQSEDRIVHLAKTHDVFIINMVTRDSVDEDVLAALQEKKVTAESFNNALKKRLFARSDALRLAVKEPARA